MTPMNGRQLIMWDLAISLIVISSILMISRLYVCLLGQASVEIAATYNGSGRDMRLVPQNQIHTYFMLLPTAQLLYFLGTGCVRLSILAFLPRLNKERAFMRWVYIVGVGIAILTVGSFFTLLFECSPVRALWDKMMPGAKCLAQSKEAALMYIHSGLSIFFDLVLLIMPMWVLHRKMIFTVRTLKVAIVFAVGVFTVVTGIIRLSTIIMINMADNTTYNVTFAAVWTNLEGHCGLWVACFPALQPLIRRVAVRLGLRPASSKRSSNPTNKLPTNDQSYASTRISMFLHKWVHLQTGTTGATNEPASGEHTASTISNRGRMPPPSKTGDTGCGTVQSDATVSLQFAGGGGESADGTGQQHHHSEEEENWEDVDFEEPIPDGTDLESGEELQVLVPQPLSGIMRTTVVRQESEARTSLYDRECIRGWKERDE
ncbi:uncharacterized protein BKCO1_4400015 [Diplodia corticola]|uniref:Integral membrane protein n=1 Tax=Diplodia corticola TaxID=236234 RepID=A0A1J9RV85_9PEZI|nr:uncharacterized protein BKCO1_4400015 [Diplodia corticola]OJD31764.1 integral membrane protein [Diplodia corticola]